jgi:LPS-assembly lipoprotein
MSSPRGRRQFLALSAALLCGACGFRPLYGDRDRGGDGSQAALETVRIAPIEERTGQQLYNALRDRLNLYGKPAVPVYVLEVKLKENRDSVFIRQDETASRRNLTVIASYTLRRSEDNKVMLRGQSQSTSSFDILNVEVQFATVVSEEDALRRTTHDLADTIATRLAVYFAQPSPPPSDKENEDADKEEETPEPFTVVQ